MLRTAALIFLAAVTLPAADTPWLNAVTPIITPAEKKTWLTLPVQDRESFEKNFWETRSIDRLDRRTRWHRQNKA